MNLDPRIRRDPRQSAGDAEASAPPACLAERRIRR